MTSEVVRIAIVAGEASGAGQGFDVWYPSEKLAVLGYAEALKHYFEISSIRSKLKRRLLADPPDIFIGVDAPDFNLALEKCMKQHGIPSVHYVSPSIWAWRGQRIHKIGAAVSRVLALFPFEPVLDTRWLTCCRLRMGGKVRASCLACRRNGLFLPSCRVVDSPN